MLKKAVPEMPAQGAAFVLNVCRRKILNTYLCIFSTLGGYDKLGIKNHLIELLFFRASGELQYTRFITERLDYRLPRMWEIISVLK